VHGGGGAFKGTHALIGAAATLTFDSGGRVVGNVTRSGLVAPTLIRTTGGSGTVKTCACGPATPGVINTVTALVACPLGNATFTRTSAGCGKTGRAVARSANQFPFDHQFRGSFGTPVSYPLAAAYFDPHFDTAFSTPFSDPFCTPVPHTPFAPPFSMPLTCQLGS
jgi:hypothetical protein